MKTSKMLAMEPMAAPTLIRALSRQLSHAFIMLDSQPGTSLSDSVAWRMHGMQLVLEATWSCRCTDFKLIELLVAA